jgi:hypothetical protein
VARRDVFFLRSRHELPLWRSSFPERAETDKPKGLAGNAERLAS